MKKNWIFIRGLGRDSRHWGDFITLFKKHFNDQAVHLMDIPGSGRYSSERCPSSVSQIVDIMVERWQAQHPNESANVIALSFGAMLAVDWMTRYPGMIESAVLMNTSDGNWSRFYRRLQYQIYPDLLLMLVSSTFRRERKIIELTSNLYPSRKALTTTWNNYAQQSHISHWNLLRQLWAAARFILPEEKPQQPVLLLNSLSDRLVHPDCSKAIAEKWQVTINRHPAAGHDISLDAPLWVIEQIKAWDSKFKQ